MGMVMGLLMIVITLMAMFGVAYVTGTTSNGVAIVRRPNLRSSVTRSSLGASLSNCNCEVLGMRDAKNGQSSWVGYVLSFAGKLDNGTIRLCCLNSSL